MKLTKRLEAVLKRWNTGIRQTPSVVVHATCGRRTTVDPLTFAVYETAIKAIYALNQSMPSQEFSNMTWEEHLLVERRWYGMIAVKDGFDVPEVTSATDPETCYSDWIFCRQLILREGLYYELLD
jgi:hypothetical protein